MEQWIAISALLSRWALQFSAAPAIALVCHQLIKQAVFKNRLKPLHTDCWMVVIGLSNVFSKLSKVTSPCTLKLVATCQGTEYLVVTYLPACSSLLTSEVSPDPSYLPQTCPLLFERNPNYKVPRYVLGMRSMCCDMLSLGLLCVSTLILSIQVTLFKKSWVHFCKARPCCYVVFREAFSWQSFQTSHIYSFKI